MKNFTTFSSGWVASIFLPGLLVFLILNIDPVIAQQGVVPVTIPDGGCAIDGNLLARTPSTPPFSPDHGDFLANENASGTGGSVFSFMGIPLDSNTAFHVIDGYDAADLCIFTQGSKFNHDPNNWVWTNGKPPGKDDINHVLFFFSEDTLGNIWFTGSSDRKKTNGNTYMDFELLQNPVYKNTDGTFTSMGPDGGRTIGDLVLSVTYTNGGTLPQMFVYQWNDTGQGAYDYVLVNQTTGTTFLATNAESAILVPYGAFGTNMYEESAFTEISCNLNEVVPGTYACLDIKTVIVKTKASQSFNAVLKDMIEPVQVDISSAPVISSNDETICLGDTALLSATINSGTGPYTYLWSTGDTTPSIMVSPDTTTNYTVVVTGINGCPSTPDTSTVTVLIAECYIMGPDTACPQGTYQFYGPDTLSSYSWTVHGPATIVGDTSGQIAEVHWNGTCDTSFILELDVTGYFGCSSTCSKLVYLVDNTSPVFTYVPESLTLMCASQVPVASIDSIEVSDNCNGNIMLAVSDSISNDSCVNQYIITRTWTATDSCGNFAETSQIINVMDTIAPTLIGMPADTGVCCADSIPPPANVTAVDSCDGAVDVMLTEVVSDSTSPFYFTLTRTWTAADTCGNSISDSQVIEVNDTLYSVGVGKVNMDNIIRHFNVSPNPFSSTLNIEFSLYQDMYVSLELYNYTGVKLRSIYQGIVIAGNNVSLQLTADGALQSGMYLLVLRTNYGVETRSILLKR